MTQQEKLAKLALLEKKARLAELESKAAKSSAQQQEAFDPNAVEPNAPFGEFSPRNAISSLVGLLGGSTSATGRKAVDVASLGRGNQIFGKEQMAQDAAQNPISTAAGYVPGIAANAAAFGPLGAVGGGAAQGALSPADSMQERAINTAVGAGTGGLLQLLGKGARMVGDRAMQQAVGRTKYTPGVGEELVDQGIFGTRGMMRKQVAAKEQEVFNKMLDAAKSAPDARINPAPIAAKLETALQGKIPAQGAPSIQDLPTINAVKEAADDIAARGPEDLLTGLTRRRAAGSRAFGIQDEAKRNLTSQLAKLEQQGYSQALKEAAPDLIPLDKSYGALAKAAKGLNKEETLSQLISLNNALKAAAVGGAYTAGGPVGALGAAALSTPAGQSLAAQGLVRGGRAIAGPTAVSLASALERLRKEQSEPVK